MALPPICQRERAGKPCVDFVTITPSVNQHPNGNLFLDESMIGCIKFRSGTAAVRFFVESVNCPHNSEKEPRWEPSAVDLRYYRSFCFGQSHFGQAVS